MIYNIHIAHVFDKSRSWSWFVKPLQLICFSHAREESTRALAARESNNAQIYDNRLPRSRETRASSLYYGNPMRRIGRSFAIGRNINYVKHKVCRESYLSIVERIYTLSRRRPERCVRRSFAVTWTQEFKRINNDQDGSLARVASKAHRSERTSKCARNSARDSAKSAENGRLWAKVARVIPPYRSRGLRI